MYTTNSSHKEQVLVYHHQPRTTPVVKDGLAVVPISTLKEILLARNHTRHPETTTTIANFRPDPLLKLTRKPLEKGARHVDIFQRDLWTDGEKEANKDLPHASLNLADIHLSFRVVIERFFGEFKEIIILSEKGGDDVIIEE